MYPGITPSFGSSLDRTKSSSIDVPPDVPNVGPKRRPESGDETTRVPQIPARTSPPHGVRVRGFGETPGTLRDNQVDAPLEAGEPAPKGSDSPPGRAFDDPDAGTRLGIEDAPPAASVSASARASTKTTQEFVPIFPLVAVSSVVGRLVKNPEGVALGTVRELMANMHSGAIAFAIIAVSGGVLGSDEALTSLPWKALRIQSDGSIIYDSLGSHDA